MNNIITTLNRRYQYRIYPTKDQANFMRRNCGAARYVYNELLKKGEEDMKNHRRVKRHSYTEFFVDAPWLKEMDSCALDSAKRDYYKALTRYFEDPKTGKPIKKTKKNSRYSYRTNCQKSSQTIWVKKNWLKLPKMRKPVKIVKHRKLPENCRITSVTVTERTRDEWYASICFEYEVTIPERLTIPWERIRGLDYSSPLFYVDDLGESPEMTCEYRVNEGKISSLQSKKDHRHYLSNNWWKAKNTVAKEYAKIADRRKDFLDKESTRIAGGNGLVMVEDLNLKSLAQLFNFGKATNDNSFGLFRMMLTYKLGDQGGALVKLPKFFASSKLCNHCGYKNDDLALGQEEWDCPNCESHNLRDKNAGMNLRECGIFGLLYDGYITEVIDENGESVLVRETFRLDGQDPDLNGLFRLVRDYVLPDGVRVVAVIFDARAAYFNEDGEFVLSPVMISEESSKIWSEILASREW